MSDSDSVVPPPRHWPVATKDVYEGLQTYRIVGASACVAAIMRALRDLAAYVAVQNESTVYRELMEAGALFCSLKPSTAAYANAVHWLLQGLDEDSEAEHAAARVVAGVERYSAYSRRSVKSIVDESCDLLPRGGHLLIHDYSSTVLAIVREAGRQGKHLTVFVTAGAPVNQGGKVAEAVVTAGHHLTYLPDAGVGRVMGEVDVVLSGVETLFRNGDLANTIGTYPIALIAREAQIPIYGVTERTKIHPTATDVTVGELTARVLHPWPPNEGALPPGTDVRREVLDLTPAALMTGYVTEEGIIAPSDVAGALERLYRDLEDLPDT